MSGFRLTGGAQRGGKMSEAAREMHTHTLARREAALRAAVAHTGASLAELLRVHGAQRSRVVSVDRETAAGTEQSVELDGVPVWRGGWRWEGYAATWHEEPLTEWMAAALAARLKVVT